MARYLIATVPQIDGGERRLYAASRAMRDEARQIIAEDAAMIDDIAEYVSVTVDRYADGTMEQR